MSRATLLLGLGRIDRSGAKSSEGDSSNGVKGRGRVGGIVLTLVLLLALSLAMVPAAQALPLSSPLRAPWTPLPVNDPVTPLTDPITPLASAPPAPVSDDLSAAIFKPVSLPAAPDGTGPTPGTALPIASDTPGTGGFLAPATDPWTELQVQVAVQAVPEPSTVILLGIGLLTVIIIGSRRGSRRGERVRHR